MTPLHPSLTTPQLKPAGQAVLGVHVVPHLLAMGFIPPPQDWLAGQVPQFRVPEHPSLTVPQSSPAGQAVLGTHTPPVPQTLGLLLAPQTRPPVQVPQL